MSVPESSGSCNSPRVETVSSDEDGEREGDMEKVLEKEAILLLFLTISLPCTVLRPEPLLKFH